MTLRDKIENVVVDDMTPKQVRYLQPVRPDQASDQLAELYQQVRRDFQLVPPITLFSPAPDLLAGAWSIVREAQVVTGRVSRKYKEAVSAAVSHTNTCPYCVDAHVGLLHGTGGQELANAIVEGDTDRIDDAQARNIVDWALATRTPTSPLLTSPPFSTDEAPEIIGTALAYHFVNRMVSVFLSPSPLPVSNSSPGIKQLITRVFGATAGKSIGNKQAAAGDSLIFLPKADLPEDFSWAKPNPDIGAAFAGFSVLMETAGRETVPQEVRERLLQRLEQWQGEEMGLDRQWLEDATDVLADQHQAIARLVMMAAFAPYQTDEKVINAFRDQYPDAAELLAATSWASYATTRRISQWIQPATTTIGEQS